MVPLSISPAPGPARLVVIVLRGAMDGLAACAPYADPNFAALSRPGRPGPGGYVDLDGFFSLHPSLARLMPLWQKGDLAVVHAVATPYRDQRSHFDGQDFLEFGKSSVPKGASRSGWLNRLLGELPHARRETGCAVGSDQLAILSGAVDVHRWSPDGTPGVSAEFQNLCLRAAESDTEIATALSAAFAVQGAARDTGAASEDRAAAYAANRLNDDARIAAFSIDGWDTHNFQHGTFTRAMDKLAGAIFTLHSIMSDTSWSHTTIIAMTEFGRTVRFNGTEGTDHGTGSAMLVAGGAINGGRVYGDWPGLAESDLYDRRDLLPTRDLRSHVGWVLRGQFGLQRHTIEKTIFPGLEMGDDPGLI
ncbi:MAG: DUF1501 domain-containing protein [Pseudomonadota bacterium]